jgi:hypothetical protein
MLLEIAATAAVVLTPQPRPDSETNVGVTIHLRTDVPANLLSNARQHAAAIYAAAGITIVWHDQDSASTCTARHPELSVGIVREPERGRKLQDGAMGLAIVSPTSTGGLAYIFYTHVQRTARTHYAEPGAVLGHAVAHELGHLLLPYGSHSATGLMRARWQTADFKALSTGSLRFSEKESVTMREQIDSAGQPRSPSAVRGRSVFSGSPQRREAPQLLEPVFDYDNLASGLLWRRHLWLYEDETPIRGHIVRTDAHARRWVISLEH